MGTTLRLLIHRIRRADTILRIATNGFDAMETMEPVDFLEFRDYLIPASGFQARHFHAIILLFLFTHSLHNSPCKCVNWKF